MLNAIIIGLKAIGIGGLLSIPAIGLGYYWHNRHGWRWRDSLFFCIVLVLVQQVWLKTLAFGPLVLIAVAISISAYRLDIYWDMQRQGSDEAGSSLQQHGEDRKP